jgi:hypothetical protein
MITGAAITGYRSEVDHRPRSALRGRGAHGRPAWQVTLPGTLAAPLSAAVGGMLVYTVVPGRVMAP